MPVYNEAATIVQILDRVYDQAWPVDIEVVAVNDCSADDTAEILNQQAERRSNLRVISHHVNQGKGAAIRTAIENARGDILAIQDADMEYDPADLVALLKPILDNEADVVYGSRFLAGCKSPKLNQLANKFLTGVSNIVNGQKLTDMETCYKVFRASTIEGITLRSNRFGMEPEITAKIAKRGVTIHELPICYHYRDYDQGKKINWWDGVKALFAIFYFQLFD